MKLFERYFERNTIAHHVYFPNHPKGVIVIPVLDDWDIFITMDRLKEGIFGEGNVGVLIVVNHGEDADEAVKVANERLVRELKLRYCSDQSETDAVYVIIMEAFDLPSKFAGVGLARKLGMDAVAHYLYRHGSVDVPILSLDADTWVDKNYTDEVITYFRENAVAGVSIAYAHRLEECDEPLRDAIVKYELYLRYYQHALSYIGHPHAFHCIGSAFAVRAVDYVAQGGMNKRQAGEDFYFLQKLISTGRYATLRTTKVFPSARFSSRTPFGTGQSVRQIVVAGGRYQVYCWNAFRDLKEFFVELPSLYKAERNIFEQCFERQTATLQAFLTEITVWDLLQDANANSASLTQFMKRFFGHFNAFRVLKYLNFAHERGYDRVDIEQAIEDLFKELCYPIGMTNQENLEFLRQL